jgi:hypothetical protein
MSTRSQSMPARLVRASSNSNCRQGYASPLPVLQHMLIRMSFQLDPVTFVFGIRASGPFLDLIEFKLDLSDSRELNVKIATHLIKTQAVFLRISPRLFNRSITWLNSFRDTSNRRDFGIRGIERCGRRLSFTGKATTAQDILLLSLFPRKRETELEALRHYEQLGSQCDALANTPVFWPACRQGPPPRPHPHTSQFWQGPAGVVRSRIWRERLRVSALRPEVPSRRMA